MWEGGYAERPNFHYIDCGWARSIASRFTKEQPYDVILSVLRNNRNHIEFKFPEHYSVERFAAMVRYWLIHGNVLTWDD